LVNEGEEAPDFTLLADDGRKVSLKDYRGKKVVLYFYPKDGTPGCTREAIEFKDMAKEFEKEGAVILGVSKDSIKSHQKFKQKHELPFTLLSDPEGKALDLYGVWKKNACMPPRTSFAVSAFVSVYASIGGEACLPSVACRV